MCVCVCVCVCVYIPYAFTKFMLISIAHEKVPNGNTSVFYSVAQLCPTLCDPLNRSTPGLPVYH